ncbi:hypothetical protein [Bacillus fonticola]|uniref:hypothetical protein n=1 Tax=Bacillus fonticola TaxID=2728853 RepID=UPI0014731005|nr:hypothetical protein [Bacillus fonticola]
MKKVILTSLKWSMSIAVITFVLAALFSMISNTLLGSLTWTLGLGVVFIIVLIGVVFDMMGMAAAAADESPFHAMASRKVYGAKHSLRIVKNADRFSSFCNDVIGDISGIISGAASATVIVTLTHSIQEGNNASLEDGLNVLLTSFIAALTVGGKALGKTIAIKFSKNIILRVGCVLQLLEERFYITVLVDPKIKNRKKKRK